MLRILRFRRFRNVYLLRGLAVWAAVRVAAGFAQVPATELPQKALILTVVAAAVLLDARRREEDVFLANVGVRGRAIAGTGIILPFLIELLVW